MGPLAGQRIIEIAGLGPAPYCAMKLADMGAEVVRIERPEPQLHSGDHGSAMHRNRRRICIDLKSARGIELLLRLVRKSDVLIEGFRPGVAERLGFGPEACLEQNPGLVYGRVTGWGRKGPLAAKAGHDLNYLAASGLLHAIGGSDQRPVPPLNAVGDFGGGGLLLAFGIVCALLEKRSSGCGQVVDAAMIDGAASFLAPFMGAADVWGFDERPGRSLLAGAAPYYDVYETRDGGFMSVAAIEPQFYQRLIDTLGLDAKRFLPAGFPATDATTRRDVWPALKKELATIFHTRTREEWTRIFRDVDACVMPVLPLSEAIEHPHHYAWGTFARVEGVVQPAPSPRFSRTRCDSPRPVSRLDSRAVLSDLGWSSEEIEALVAEGVVGSGDG